MKKWKQRVKKVLAAAVCAAVCLSGNVMTPIEVHAATGTVHVYADTPGDVVSSKYHVTVNGTEVPAIMYKENGNNFDIVRFATDTMTPELTVQVPNEEINTVKVYPERYYPQENLQISEDKHSLTFTMADNNLRYAFVMINGGPADQSGKPYLAVINDPMETGKPDISASNVLNFKAFSEAYLAENPNSAAEAEREMVQAGVTSGGTTYNAGTLVDNTTAQVRFPDKRKMTDADATYALEAALDEIYKEGSVYDTLYFPAGTYTYSGLEIRNRNGKHVNIYVEEGALLKNRIQECMQAMEPAIGIWDSSDITISGRGIFDGNGVENYRKDRHDAKDSCHQGGVMIVRSSNIVFNDTYVRDAKQWNWESHGSKNCTLNNVKGLTPYPQPWVDGFDMASAQNLNINGGLTLGNDDCFASGHYNPSDGFTDTVPGYDEYNADCLKWDVEDSFNVQVNNTLGWSNAGGNGIRMGHNVYGHQMKDYMFNNFNAVNFQGGGRGVTVQNQTGTYPRYETIVIKNSSFDTTRVGANLDINGKADQLIDTVTVENCWFSNAEAVNGVQNIRNLTIKDLYMGGKKVEISTDANLTAKNITNPVYDWIENHEPQFTAPETEFYSVKVGEPLEFTVVAADEDEGDTVRLSVENLPETASFEETTGEFSWTPSETESGKYEITFTATDQYGVAVQKKVQISVKSGMYTVTDTVVKEDAFMGSWKTDKTNKYGNDNFLRVRRMVESINDGSLGLWGETVTNTTDARDAKIAVLKFDAAELKANLENLEKAELELTYVGRRDDKAVGDDRLMAIAGENNWEEATVTWNTRPEWDIKNVKYSDAFKVDNCNWQGNKQEINTEIDGTRVLIDVTDFVKNLKDVDNFLTLAVSDEKGYEMAFVSREGAQKLTNAKGQEMAPVIHMYVKNTSTVTERTEITGISATANSQQDGNANGAQNAVDGKEETKWHSSWASSHPTVPNLYITLDLGDVFEEVTRVSYLPRQDKKGGAGDAAVEKNGDIIGYEIWISATGAEGSFTKVAEGSWEDNKEWKSATFDPAAAKYVRLVATKTTALAAKDYDQFASAAEIKVYHGGTVDIEGKKEKLHTVLQETEAFLEECAKEESELDVLKELAEKGKGFYSSIYSTEEDVEAICTAITTELERVKGLPDQAVVESLELVTPPAKTEYFVGEQIDISGMQAEAHYSDGTTKDVTEDVVITGFDTSAVCDSVTVTVSFGGKESTFTIKVSAKEAPVLSEIQITADPVKTEYCLGETLDLTGMEVTAVYSDSTTENVTSGIQTEGFDSSKPGVCEVKVSYEGKTTTFNVNIKDEVPADVTLTGIEFTAPVKTEYTVGETLDTTGMKVLAVYSNGVKREVTLQAVTGGFDSSEAGDITVTVSYTEKEVTQTAVFTVKVTDEEITPVLSRIEVTTLPTKTEYLINEELDLTGMVVTAYYSDGTSTVINGEDYLVSGFDSSAAGKGTVTLAYGDKTTTFEITVKDDTQQEKELAAIRIEQNPTKVEYEIGEECDLTGMQIMAVYSDGSEEDVTADVTISGFDSAQAGPRAITVTYQEKTAVFMVTVKAKEVEESVLKEITVTAPTKTEYIQGEPLDLAGMKVTAVYEDGTTKDVTALAKLSGYDPANPGEVTVTVTYQGFLASFKVTVKEKTDGGDSGAGGNGNGNTGDNGNGDGNTGDGGNGDGNTGAGGNGDGNTGNGGSGAGNTGNNGTGNAKPGHGGSNGSNSNGQNNSSVNTGDMNQPVIWMGLMFAALSICVPVLAGKKKSVNKNQ